MWTIDDVCLWQHQRLIIESYSCFDKHSIRYTYINLALNSAYHLKGSSWKLLVNFKEIPLEKSAGNVKFKYK